MWRRLLMACSLLLVPGVSWAQGVPERLLPSGSQIYLRWDGFAKSRAAYDKTAVGRMMQDDTGRFLSALWTYAYELMDLGLRQADPNAVALAKEVPSILSGIVQHGFLFGFEVKALNPPQVEAVVVFPKASKGPLVPMIDKLAGLAKAKVQETKVGKRSVHELGNEQIHFGWWSEPDEAVVLALGTTPLADLAKAAAAPKSGFAQSKTYAKLAGFKQFPTWGRGHVDIAGLLQRVGELSPNVDTLIGELGLKELEGVTFYSGFEGAGERSIVEMNTPGTRKGLLGLINKKTITLADLPPLPSDVTSFSASNFNVRSLYDGGLTIAEAAVNAFANGAIDPKESVRQVEALLGIKFGEDLFGAFDDLFVSYSSPAEGPFGLGGVYLFKLKDANKLGETLEGLFKAIPPFPGAEVSYKKRPYRGGEVLELKLKTDQGEFAIATMAIHKGWFMLANYPQSIYGFILRSNGDLPAWTADAKLTKALAAFPKEFTAISISDPRPTLQALLALAPTVFTVANSVLPNVLPGAPTFDVGVIPHAQDAVRHLFPNITVTTDDGKKIRSETRASIALPF